MVVSEWMDEKPVIVLSTGIDTTTATVQRCVGKTGERASFPWPLPVSDYNKHMVYVDQPDALRGSYEMGRKSVRWWTYIFWYVVNTASVNAFALFSMTRKPRGEPTDSHLEFMKSLRHALLEPARRANSSSESRSEVLKGFCESPLDMSSGCGFQKHKHAQVCVSCKRRNSN